MRLQRWSLPALLLLGLAALGMAFLAGYSAPATAQEAPSAQSYTIQAGANGVGNLELLAFAPQSLQVHRGDTVTWAVHGFHNIRLGEGEMPSIVMAEVDGNTIPAFNSELVMPNVESGGAYSGGTANSGLPQPGAPPFFSLVMDVEPGTYSYVCDVHPGMAGVITVVDDATAVPSPSEVNMQAQNEILASLGAGMAAQAELEVQSLSATDDSNTIQAGNGNTGRLTVNQYFPFTLTIQAGESVTWAVPADSVEPHLVGWPPVRGQDVEVIAAEGQPPVFAIGPSLLPVLPSESTVNLGDAFGSGLMEPGHSYTLTFAEPGVYPFTCNIHPGMNGVVVVEAAE